MIFTFISNIQIFKNEDKELLSLWLSSFLLILNLDVYYGYRYYKSLDQFKRIKKK